MLVMRGLVDSRARAKRLIESGKVLLNAEVEKKASRTVTDADDLVVVEPERFVSRSGEKLEAALVKFKIHVKGESCLDVGASTGGFTDCLLRRDAAKVFAVDVGHSQMAQCLRNDERVVLMEGVNARYLKAADFDDERFAIIVVDVSFISLEHIIPAIIDLASAQCNVIALIKPQFEVGKSKVGSGGIVRQQIYRDDAVKKIRELFSELDDWHVQDVIPSPVTGTDGNQEYLLWAKKSVA
ncbi:MAG: TlyA family RNA methyltransferase [Verrucomicrobiota bacterium]